MAFKHRYGLARFLILALMLALIIAPQAIAQDTIAGRELFEREWEFVDRAPAFTELDSTHLEPQRGHRGRGRGMGRSPHPQHRDNGQELASTLPADGLGPLHNAISCAACHPGGGASGVNHNVTQITVDPRSPFLSQPTNRGGHRDPASSVIDFFPGLLSGNWLSFNTVVHDLSTRPGYEIIRQRLSVGVPSGLQPEWFSPQERTVDAIAKQPVVAGRYGTLDYYLSQRNSPPLHGMGLIERISVNRLTAISRSQSRSSGGTISGRVAGKYGWRGQVNTLSDFVAGACATEMGLNVSNIAQQANDPADPHYVSLAADISTRQVADLTSYVADLPAPAKQLLPAEDRKRVRRGERIFSSVGCAACHIADILPARGIFSDLLLHDMGSDLQDPFPAPANQLTSTNSTAPASAYQSQYGGETSSYRIGSSPNRSGAPNRRGPPPNRRRSAPSVVSSLIPAGTPQAIAMDYPEQPQFPRGDVSQAELNGQHRFSWDALQREWKTPPLWGVADSAPYLHDGRAETLTDAIQWHGGEADESKRNFLKLNEEQKELMLAFLESLKAPSD
ncbi:Cytochrome c [Roseimaritima multifibrata]|uniref:Cytochrome c n=1 Tax=Roseimaritima multifibrata TaxID=1930274 RepID=A0A517MIH6_9BACT|nr:di-heme oxidoredictase family protein [Roseimaritima multifibrata]QDS94691.1 Cytochrome c [Roseimaritima multifibrata]